MIPLCFGEDVWMWMRFALLCNGGVSDSSRNERMAVLELETRAMVHCTWVIDHLESSRRLNLRETIGLLESVKSEAEMRISPSRDQVASDLNFWLTI
jgi:hypothetical protein